MLVHTVQNPWMKVRTEVSSTDTLMTADGAGSTPRKCWTERDTTKGQNIPLGANGVKVALMGDDEDSDATITVWVYAERGPAEWVIGATFTIGAMEVVEDPTTNAMEATTLNYADAITVVDQGWPNKLLNTIDAGGDDGIAQIIFEACGARFIKVEVSALDSGLKVTPIFTYW